MVSYLAVSYTIKLVCVIYYCNLPISTYYLSLKRLAMAD